MRRGRTATTWVDRDERTGRLYAVKLLQPNVPDYEQRIGRFSREVSNTRVLQHPNLVRVKGIRHSRGRCFLVLDYCEGGNVAELMRRQGGTLSFDEAVEIV